MRHNPAVLTAKLATLATLAEQTRHGTNGDRHPVPQRRLPLGTVIVQLQALKRKYSEMERNRAAFRAQIATQKPGAYDGYKVVSVREVQVKAHTRKAHKRVLLAK